MVDKEQQPGFFEKAIEVLDRVGAGMANFNFGITSSRGMRGPYQQLRLGGTHDALYRELQKLPDVRTLSAEASQAVVAQATEELIEPSPDQHHLEGEI